MGKGGGGGQGERAPRIRQGGNLATNHNATRPSITPPHPPPSLSTAGGTLKLAYPSTQQQLLVWKTPPRT
jgi:hypothetical protein